MTGPAAPRRLVVALPAEEAALDLLCLAADLAVRLERECVGLIVESEALVAAAALPFVRTVSTRGIGEAAFDPGASRRALQVLAARARERLGTHMATTRLRWSLEIVRGGLESLALGTEDLLALGRIDPLGPGSVPADALLPCPLVMVAGGPGPVLVLFAGSAETIELGQKLAAVEQRDLQVGVVQGGISTAAELVDRARVLLGAEAGEGPVRPVDPDGVETLLAAVRPGLVVIDSCGTGTLWRRLLLVIQKSSRRIDLHHGRLA